MKLQELKGSEADSFNEVRREVSELRNYTAGAMAEVDLLLWNYGMGSGVGERLETLANRLDEFRDRVLEHRSKILDRIREYEGEFGGVDTM